MLSSHGKTIQCLTRFASPPSLDRCLLKAHSNGEYLAMASNSQTPLSLSPPPIPPSQPAAPVRRHHTISASSRSARAANRSVISEETQDWDEAEDEYLGDSWSGSNIGAVGEGKSLHRQASLPSRYNRGVCFSFFPHSSPDQCHIASISIFRRPQCPEVE